MLQDTVQREDWLEKWAENFRLDMTRCSRCLYDETTPSIVFDSSGVCNYCHISDQLDRDYPNDERGEKILADLADRIKRDGRGKKYDVAVGVSGGCVNGAFQPITQPSDEHLCYTLTKVFSPSEISIRYFS